MNAVHRFYVWSLVSTVEALTHYTQNSKYAKYLPYTIQYFFHNRYSFPIVLYMGNDFHNDIFEKIFSVLHVVCKSL